MSAKRTIAALLDGACESAEAICLAQACPERSRRARQVVRQAWTKEIMAKIRAAQKAVDEAWNKYLDEIEAEGIDAEESEDPPPFPEQEALDALLEQAHAVRDHDRWPRELYWGGI